MKMKRCFPRRRAGVQVVENIILLPVKTALMCRKPRQECWSYPAMDSGQEICCCITASDISRRALPPGACATSDTDSLRKQTCDPWREGASATALCRAGQLRLVHGAAPGVTRTFLCSQRWKGICRVQKGRTVSDRDLSAPSPGVSCALCRVPAQG